MIYNSYDKPPRIASPSGSAIVPDPQEKTAKDGRKYLSYTDSAGDPYEVNFFESICSHESTVDLATKIARAQGGDPEALKTRTGVYVDISSAPTSFIEAHKMNMDAELKFNNLPNELKALFGNLAGFKSACLDGTLDNRIASFVAKKQQEHEAKSDKQVKADE